MPGIETHETAFARVEDTLKATGPDRVHDLRRDALKTFTELGFPGLRHEAWRGTRVRAIAERDFEYVEKYRPDGLTGHMLTSVSFDDVGCCRAVVANGHFSKNLSQLDGIPEGVTVMSLARALEEHPDRVERHLARHADMADNAFVALNTAFLRDGVYVEIADNVVLDHPLHIVFVTNVSNSVSHPRALVVAGRSSEATIVESYVGTASDYFTNPVTEIVCAENANLTHCKLQRENQTAFHVATQQTYLAANSTFSTENVSYGGALVRNDINSLLDGEGIHCRLDGLYLANEKQHVDNHTFIRHAKPNCNSFELYKGILNGKSRGVFNGKIYVDPDAQKTDAKQSNNCILLSDDARINTQPQLEIFADDVKCTHGATIGQLDPNSVFYMRSRGIPLAEARHILVYAFAAEVLERIKIDRVRTRLEADLFNWLDTNYTH